MNEKAYNGWTNYETWLVKLWQDNSEGDQAFWRDQAEERLKTDGRKSAVGSLADIMKERYEEMASELSGVTGFWADLLNASLSDVNWREISQHWIIEAYDALTSEGVEIDE